MGARVGGFEGGGKEGGWQVRREGGSMGVKIEGREEGI